MFIGTYVSPNVRRSLGRICHMRCRALLIATLVTAVLPPIALGAAVDDVIARRTATPPQIDGTLSEDCWKSAVRVDHFSLPNSDIRPDKPLEFRVCFDDSTLYCSFRNAEPHPDQLRLRHRGDDESVWRDDSVEVFLRVTGDGLDFDQFIVNAAGARWSRRQRRGHAKPTPRDWAAAANIGRSGWTVEMALPLTALGLDVMDAVLF